jgi:ubiquinone/menaquinone biosynthesis C-methylase UbiE
MLEIGCGSGELLRLLQNRVNPSQLVGVDRAWNAIRSASTIVDPRISLCVGDATCLPFADRTFTHLVAFGVIEHIERFDLTLEEIRRVTVPGARIRITTSNRRSVLQGINYFRQRMHSYPYGYQKNWTCGEFCNLLTWADVEDVKVLQADWDMPFVRLADALVGVVAADWGRYIMINCVRK